MGENAGPLPLVETDGDELGPGREIHAIQGSQPAVDRHLVGGEQSPVVGRPGGGEHDVVEEKPEARPQVAYHGGIESRMTGRILGNLRGAVDAEPGEEEGVELGERPPIG